MLTSNSAFFLFAVLVVWYKVTVQLVQNGQFLTSTKHVRHSSGNKTGNLNWNDLNKEEQSTNCGVNYRTVHSLVARDHNTSGEYHSSGKLTSQQYALKHFVFTHNKLQNYIWLQTIKFCIHYRMNKWTNYCNWNFSVSTFSPHKLLHIQHNGKKQTYSNCQHMIRHSLSYCWHPCVHWMTKLV